MRKQDAFTLGDLPKPGEEPQVIDLMEALKESLASKQRTDPHRPGAIMPPDYKYVLSFGRMPPSAPGQPPVRYNVDLALKMWKEEKFFRIRSGIFTCVICGAHYDHGDIWLHVPTGEHITLGHDCADKYGMHSNRNAWRAWHRQQTKLRAQAAKEKKYKMAALRFLDERPELKAVFDSLPPKPEPRPVHEPDERHQGPLSCFDAGCPVCSFLDPVEQAVVGRDGAFLVSEPRQVLILREMLGKLNHYGSMSDRAVEFALKLAQELEAAKNAPPREEEKHVPAPEGRVQVRGRVVSVKRYEGEFGVSYKMTVKVQEDEGSWLVWVSVPSGLEVERGETVEFRATLKRGLDEHFALGKRPTNARVIKEEISGEDHEHELHRTS